MMRIYINYPIQIAKRLFATIYKIPTRMNYSKSPRASTVAACIIGDEVLNGKTLDTNSNYLGKSTQFVLLF